MRRLLVALVLLASWVSGQTSIVLANLADTPRTSGWVTVVVPNDHCPQPPVAILAGSALWKALYGAPWGPKARLVHVRYLDLAPLEHAQVSLVHAEGEEIAKASVPAVDASLITQALPVLCVNKSTGATRVTLLPTKTLEDIHRHVLYGAVRVPGTMFIVLFWYYLLPGSRSIGFELQVVNSDPRYEEPVETFDSIVLETPRSIFPAFDYHVRRGGGPTVVAGKGLATKLFGTGSTTWLGDGQAMSWRGRLVMLAGATDNELYELLPELREPVIAMVLPKHWQGSWGPWGELPKLHPNEQTPDREYGVAGVRELYMRYAAKVGRPDDHPSGALFAEPDWGQVWLPSMSGDHEDFGVTKLAPALSPAAGGPSHLHDVGMAALYEMLRPSYFYEADGEPLRPDDHPHTIFWGLHNHYHVGLSTDRLGKSLTAPDPANGAKFQDWAHMSLNSVYGWCQLTGSYMGRQTLHQIETGWLLGSRIGSNLSEPRGWGRSMTAMAWSWLTTGDRRIVERMRARWQSSFDEYLQRTNNAVVPWGIYGPDKRKMDVPFWMPWQEHIALTGFDAGFWLCYVANTDDPAGRDKAKAVCTTMAKSIVTHGWWLHQGKWTTGDAMWYDEGRALDPAVYNDPLRVVPHWPGTDADRTGSGALLIARRWLVEAGEIELVAKVDTIMTALRAWFEGPGQERPFTRWSEWAATK